MSVTFRTYKNTALYGEDYHLIRNFLIDLDNYNYHFGRWDCMVMSLFREWADPDGIRRIGLWEESEKIVASQQFYYSIGFRPYAASTWWKQPLNTLLKETIT